MNYLAPRVYGDDIFLQKLPAALTEAAPRPFEEGASWCPKAAVSLVALPRRAQRFRQKRT
jgi:hypothetical protein